MLENNKITIIEFPTLDIEATKAFFSAVFGWSFEDQAPTYTEFSGVGVNGAFHAQGAAPAGSTNAAMMVLYSDDLEATLAKAEAAGGAIVTPTYAFPGGRRFHVKEPGGNEVSVWSDQGLEE